MRRRRRHRICVRALRAAEHALHLERAAKMAEDIAQGRLSGFVGELGDIERQHGESALERQRLHVIARLRLDQD